MPANVNTNWHTNTGNNLYTGLTSTSLPQLNNNNTNFSLPASIDDNSTTYHHWYSYGNYYSWAAAVADTTRPTGNNEHIANTSICPSGWHLPEAGDDNNAANSELLGLAVSVTGTTPNEVYSVDRSRYVDLDGNTVGTDASKAIRSFPNNFIYSGYWYGSRPYYRNSLGYYWSSSANNGVSAYCTNFDNSLLYPGTVSFMMHYGFSVRCVNM